MIIILTCAFHLCFGCTTAVILLTILARLFLGSIRIFLLFFLRFILAIIVPIRLLFFVFDAAVGYYVSFDLLRLHGKRTDEEVVEAKESASYDKQSL